MASNKDIISRLDELDRKELCILARKLGIEKNFKLYFFQKETEIIIEILNNVEDMKLIEDFLDITSMLKASGTDWLKENFPLELDLKRVPSEKESKTSHREKSRLARKIIENSTFEDILKKIMPRKLSTIMLIVFVLTFILSFIPRYFTFVASVASVVALLLALTAYAIPHISGFKKRYVKVTFAEYVYRIAVSIIIAFLCLFIFQSYPSKEAFINDLGTIATIIGLLLTVIFFYYEKPLLVNWWRRYNKLIMGGIMFLTIVNLIYIGVFTIAGKVYRLEGKDKKEVGLKVDKVRLTGINNIIYNLICKSENEKEGSFYKEFIIDPNKLCSTETDEDGNFILRAFSLMKKNVEIEVEYDGRTNNQPLKEGYIGDKEIDFEFSMLKEYWSCKYNGKSYCLKIIKKDGVLTIMDEKKPNETFEGYCFYNKEFKADEKGNFLHKIPNTANLDISEVRVEIKDNTDIIAIKFLENGFKVSALESFNNQQNCLDR